MLIGYARKSANWPLERQLDALNAAGVERLYVDEPKKPGEPLKHRREAIRALRKGDVLMLTGLHRLARNRKDLREVLAEIAAKGAMVRDALTGSDMPLDKVMLGALELFLDALEVWAGEASMPGRKAAEERGIQGGRPPKKMKISDDEVLRMWHNPKVMIEHIEKATGLKRRTLYRKFKARQGVSE